MIAMVCKMQTSNYRKSLNFHLFFFRSSKNLRLKVEMHQKNVQITKGLKLVNNSMRLADHLSRPITKINLQGIHAKPVYQLLLL